LDLYLSTKEVAKMQIDRNQKVAPSTQKIFQSFVINLLSVLLFLDVAAKMFFLSFLFNIVSSFSIGNLI